MEKAPKPFYKSEVADDHKYTCKDCGQDIRTTTCHQTCQWYLKNLRGKGDPCKHGDKCHKIHAKPPPVPRKSETTTICSVCGRDLARSKCVKLCQWNMGFESKCTYGWRCHKLHVEYLENKKAVFEYRHVGGVQVEFQALIEKVIVRDWYSFFMLQVDPTSLKDIFVNQDPSNVRIKKIDLGNTKVGLAYAHLESFSRLVQS
jgi:hypothetical protein